MSKSLVFARPDASHLRAMLEIHCDPRTNAHNPFGPPTPATALALFEGWLEQWDREGFGYWAVCSSATSLEVLGFGGIMRKHIGSRFGLNLYFRISPLVWGQGLASAIAQEALSQAFIGRCEPEVLALVRPANTISRRTLERAGLGVIDTTDDVPGQEPSLIYRISREDFQHKYDANHSSDLPHSSAQILRVRR
ncbi:GNAT family N-acetyltransferase [Roseateles oligotrophus]|uniref:GNAT family N-acetyltransferase n=1 Tax=Roseateles oligotrophus TaxID=1769250 RepID=A0ABT2YHR3_9BURK|nr:GNAT family N-acetyltransferase [Roseateles oligotrophus]MCV2369596.1 GNAT family N-acetyltransferase [Roseateles oligotrophus]